LDEPRAKAGPPPAKVAKSLTELANVSRETSARLEAYLDLLIAWNGRMNLVAASTLADAWTRHVLDSAQLLPLIAPSSRRLVDVGSGAGFPGMVLAILGALGVELVEATEKKCAFLRAVAGELGVAVEVRHTRAEILGRNPADTVTARAVAPLPRLMEQTAPLIGPRTRCLFLKGQGVEAELTEAHKIWMMRVTRVPSRTDPGGTVLILEEVRRGPRPVQSPRRGSRR